MYKRQPINRGVELNSDVADSNNSIILDQVENGVAIRMAVMYLLSLNNDAFAERLAHFREIVG